MSAQRYFALANNFTITLSWKASNRTWKIEAALTEMIRIIQEEEPSKPSARLSTDESLPSLAALRHTDPRRLMALLRGE